MDKMINTAVLPNNFQMLNAEDGKTVEEYFEEYKSNLDGGLQDVDNYQPKVNSEPVEKDYVLDEDDFGASGIARLTFAKAVDGAC